MIKLYNGDCLDIMRCVDFQMAIRGKTPIIVTDPPFNIGYHYNTYKDKMSDEQYLEWLKEIIHDKAFVLIHYPEQLYKIFAFIGESPSRVVSWVYNSNTARQHRDIAFGGGVKPDFNLVRQPYKNPNDKRIKKRIAEGKTGSKLYDWWNVNQVKNVSKDKTKHPCQMPQEVMDNIIGILPDKDKIVVIDPFMGSGTTGLACKRYNVDFVGIEIDPLYYSIATERLVNN